LAAAMGAKTITANATVRTSKMDLRISYLLVFVCNIHAKDAPLGFV
jgi:hypothetical protein